MAEVTHELHPSGAGNLFDPDYEKIPPEQREYLHAYSTCASRCGSAYYIDTNNQVKKVSENRCVDSDQEIERRFDLPQMLPAKPESPTCFFASESCVEGQTHVDTSSMYNYFKWNDETKILRYNPSTIFDEYGRAFNQDGSPANPDIITEGTAPRGQTFREALDEMTRRQTPDFQAPQYQPYTIWRQPYNSDALMEAVKPPDNISLDGANPAINQFGTYIAPSTFSPNTGTPQYQPGSIGFFAKILNWIRSWD